MKRIIPLLIASALILGACAKLQENRIINKKWHVEALYLNGNESVNAFLDLLPLYVDDGSCRYEMDFQKNNRCIGYYKRNDSLIYEMEGTWNFLEKDSMYISVDLAVHGDYEFREIGGGRYRLSSQNNNLILPGFEPIPSPAVLITKTFK
ncbi:MAG: hypothetical protein MH137_01420 [Flavobacteriales bacterium]|nr:hypothetical protein [Flavobacteriales bacterium]